MVLELHRRRQVQLLDDPGTASVVPRLVLFGPDAAQRRRSLATLVGTELHMLDIEAFDAPLDQAVELDAETARHLSRSRPLRQVFVLAPSDFDGGGIALTLARHLGPQARVVLVTESGSTPFASEIERQSGASAALASIRLFPVPEYAYSLPVLRAERMADRLARALYAVERRSGAAPWRRLGETERGEYLARAGSWLEEATTAPVRLSALVTPRPPEIPLLQALGFDRPVALARAGLRVDLQSLPVLRTAGQRLLDAGDDTAFAVWCEAARLQADVGEIARTTPDSPAGTTVRDVQELLRLKRALLGDPDARLAFAWERSSGSPSDRGHGSTAILLAGDGDDLERAALLHPLVTRSPGKVWVVAPRGPLRDAVIARGAVVPPGARDRPGDSTRRQALAVWRDVVVAGGEAADVRVVAMPAARAEDILLARALGATIGRVEVAEAVELGLLLLNGAAGVVPLPPDPMTVRAFLRPGRWPAELAAKREPLAAELHRRYMLRQRGRGRPDDLALQPWSALSPWLRRSNLAAVDDIPNKLAAAGLRLEAAHSRAVAVDGADFAVLRQQEEQLAELEHGRFTAERLLSGWTSGVRDPARFLSPDLQPWSDLDEEAKERDREAIRDLPEILAQHGLVVRPATP